MNSSVKTVLSMLYVISYGSSTGKMKFELMVSGINASISKPSA